MDIRNKIDDSMNRFEQITSRIPGYAGYKEKENRRQADAILRAHIAQQLEQEWSRMNDLKSQMLIGPGMAYLTDMGKASRRLQTLVDKIKVAAQGYAGMLDAIKVQEAELDALYQFDQEMLLKTDEVTIAVDALETALDDDGDVSAAVKSLNKVIKDLLTHFETRKDVITGFA
jgi:hypothetical protein